VCDLETSRMGAPYIYIYIYIYIYNISRLRVKNSVQFFPRIGGVEAELHSFLTSILDGVVNCTLQRLNPRDRKPVHI